MDFKKGESANPVNPGLVLYWTWSTTSVCVCRRNGGGKYRFFFNAEHKKHSSYKLFLKWVFPHWSSALQGNEPRASGSPSGTSKLAICRGKLIITTRLFLSWSTVAPQLSRWTWTVAFTYGKWRFLSAYVLPEPKITLFSGLFQAYGWQPSFTWLYWTLRICYYFWYSSAFWDTNIFL